MAYRFPRYPLAGMTAGAIGGLIGGWFKLGWDITWVPRATGRIPEPMVLVSMFTHVPAPVWLAYAVHFAFSMFCGVAYGALVEFFPLIAIGTGVGFGIAVWIGAHEIFMPWMRLTPPVWDLPANEQGSEFLGHALWGFVLGIFYHDLRARFVKPERVRIADGQTLAAPLPESVAVYIK